MLIRSQDLEAIRAGRVDLAFRRWTRPTVKAGGTLTTANGVLSIAAVDVIADDAIDDEEARRAGFRDADALREWLDTGRAGQLYRIQLRFVGPDPRLAKRDSTDAMDETRMALIRLDAKAPWTSAILNQIAAHPAVTAQVLAEALGMDKLKFKAKVRQLKALGLTESLEVGYRLSSRGQALLAPTASA